ncbi:amidohydrolase family protein [Bacteroides sp.]
MEQTTLITNALIFDGMNEKIVKGNVLIKDGIIQKISELPITTDEASTVIDGTGKFLMPGLIDAHWHSYMSCNTMMDLLTADAAYTQFKAGLEAERTLLRGFTTIRDAGGPSFGLKRAIDEGLLTGPRIYPSGAIISQTGGHGDFRAVYDEPRPFDCCGLTHTEEIGAAIIADGVDAVTVAARNNLRLGASQIKLMTGGGVASLYDRLEDTQYFEEEIHAAVQVAEDAGTYVMVHVYVPRAIARAIHAGVKSIEHGHLIDEPTMQLIAEKDVWLSMQPFTLEDNTFPTKEQQAKHEMVVHGTDNTYRLAKKYKVKLAWGTDLLFNPANTKNQNRDIGKLQAWFSNFEILKMITHDNAELLALSGNRNPYPGKLGVIEEGARADIILVNGNALEDVTLLEDPEKNLSLIMKGGKIYKSGDTSKTNSIH